MKKLFLCLSLVFLISCGAKTDFEIKNADGETGIIVQTNGSIIINNEVNGNISKDGTVTDKNGTVIATIGEDNILQDSEGKTLIKIDENGKMDNGSGTFIEWSENGELMRGNESTGMKISPVKNDAYRNASIVFFLYSSFGS